MTKAQRLAIENHRERFLVDNPESFNPHQLFPEKREVVVEIGSGMGEATAEIARTFPEKGFLAIEVHQPGIGSLILRALDYELKNLRMINDDCHLILDLIEDGSVDTFHIFFPDPWPKRKQHKRRLLQPSFIAILATKIKHGGRINIATDWYPYAQEIEKNFAGNQDFSGGVIPRPEWRPLTKFENKGITKDHVVTDFQYTRK